MFGLHKERLAQKRPHKMPNRRCKEQFKTSKGEADPKRRFLQFDVQEICDNFEKEMMNILKDVSKIHKKSTSTRAPVAEPSLFICEKPKGKSENNLEDLKDFSDSLPIFDEYDEELIESLMICEDNCDLPFLEPDFMFDKEQTIAELTFLQSEHPSSLVLFSQDFEEKPFDYPHQGPLLGTRRPMDVDLYPIFDEEDDHLDELGPTFDEKAPSMTSIIMENRLCFDPGTTPTLLSKEHCKEICIISYVPDLFDKVSSNDIKHFGLDHLEKLFELDLQQLVFCSRKSFDSFVFKENSFSLSSYGHALITGQLFAPTCALDEFMVKTLLEQKSATVETDFCDSVLKYDILCVQTDRPWLVLKSLLKNYVTLSFDDILVYNTFFEKHIEPLISDSQSELTLLCSDFEKDRHVLKMFNIVLCLDTILVCNAYFDVIFERLKRVLHVLGKETLISYLNKYMSCTYDPGILVSVLSVQDKQVQSQRSVRNKSIDHTYQPKIWRWNAPVKTNMHGLIMRSSKDICSLFDSYLPKHEASMQEITWRMFSTQLQTSSKKNQIKRSSYVTVMPFTNQEIYSSREYRIPEKLEMTNLLSDDPATNSIMPKVVECPME
ncbi:hypothetical protein F2Q70_00027959 [Brassica cretica]|uniref:Uncharacterized protein n=2 Tax=Brassica cretica TaxID=69181 RepID=A0A8S9KZW4_BRACR|nr:hypothetical protein F2Q70_00027959 [Brassica cretica]